jgi:hypothetical protein
MAAKEKMLTAVFLDRTHAQRAYERLIDRGYTSAEINVLMSADTRSNYFTEEHEETPPAAATHGLEGVAAGGAIGTAVGATLGAVAAIGATLTIPGLGLVIAGPLAAAIAGGGAGAVAGGVIGGLVGVGIPEANADAYHEALRNGGVVLGVVPHNRDEAVEIEDEFEELHGGNICYC